VKPAALSRHQNLLLWWLAVRLPLGRTVDEMAVAEGCHHCKLKPQQAIDIFTHHPEDWQRMERKRAARINGQTESDPRKVAGAHLAGLKCRHRRKLKRIQRAGFLL
jgi:hypothetical protein